MDMADCDVPTDAVGDENANYYVACKFINSDNNDGQVIAVDTNGQITIIVSSSECPYPLSVV